MSIKSNGFVDRRWPFFEQKAKHCPKKPHVGVRRSTVFDLHKKER